MPAAPELQLLYEGAQLAGRVGELGGKVARTNQECKREVEDVHFEGVGLQGHLHSTALQLSGICHSWTAVRERLEQHRRRLAAGHLRPESLLSSWFPFLSTGWLA